MKVVNPTSADHFPCLFHFSFLELFMTWLSFSICSKFFSFIANLLLTASEGNGALNLNICATHLETKLTAGHE